ncbi:hypothetical protein ACKWTF_001284 [Chironomus riparius]
MNHRILFCLVLVLGNFLAASADCLDSNPGDVEYDCMNDVGDTRHEEASEEKIDDVVDLEPEYQDIDEPDTPPESPESTSTSTTVKSTTEDEIEYDYDSEEHEDPDTQQDETHNEHIEATEHTGMLNDDDSAQTTIQTTIDNDDQHINLFYDAIKTTLTSTNYRNAYRYVKHPERVECMITQMRKSKVMDKINKESFVFKKNIEQEVKFEFRNVTTFMYDLEREIQDANFDCTEMGNTRIYVLIFVALLAIVLLVLYIRRR